MLRPVDDALALYVARRARELGLNLPDLEEANLETLRAFVRAVLIELAALGLVPGEEEIGCWSAPRSGHH